MRKTKMIKVSSSGWRWIFGLTIELLVLALQPQSLLAQTQAANTATASLEPEILSEINRVRTNPQDYALWLEQQRQYYDGIWLKLPGEKPVRTNRGRKALEEAIAVLKEQSPLPALATSDRTAATATSELENFANANNIQFFSYGRKTAKGIVMDLVVDELFPDRRRRQSLLSSEAEDTGVACKPDPRYAKVCAITYSDTPTTNPSPNTAQNTDVAIAKPEDTTQDATQAEVKPPETPNNDSAASPTSPTPEKPTDAVTEETEADSTLENDTTDKESDLAALPQPPQPQVPPAPKPPENNPKPASEAGTQAAEKLPLDRIEAEIEQEQQELEDEESPEQEAAEDLESEAKVEVSEDSENKEVAELEEAEAEAEADLEPEVEVSEDEDSENDEVAELEEPVEAEDTETDSDLVAINAENAGIEDKIEEGALEDGDRVIEEDGSLYDFYPIQGKAGESFTIFLESDEFDAFVALVDSNGNTVGENDDISQSDSNSQLEITLPADGVYNIIVNTYDREGKGKYVLNVSRS